MTCNSFQVLPSTCCNFLWNLFCVLPSCIHRVESNSSLSSSFRHIPLYMKDGIYAGLYGALRVYNINGSVLIWFIGLTQPDLIYRDN